MRLISLFIVFIGSIVVASAQTPVPSTPATPPSAVTTNQTASTNQVDPVVLQQLLQRMEELQQRAEREKAQSEKLGAQLADTSQRIDQIRETEAGSRSTLYNVLFFVIGLAAISIIGLVAFCFYTLRRLTQLGEPIFDNFHKPHLPALPHGSPAGVLHQIAPVSPLKEGQPTTLAHAGETRLLDAVDRLEKKIEEMERVAHHDNNHVSATIHAPVPPPAAPAVNGATNAVPVTPEVDVTRSFRQADRLVLLMNKGEAHTNLGQFDKATECFDQAILLAPTDPAPVVKKGYALEKAGRTEEALQCYDQAINLDPGYSMAYLFKGGVCNRLQRYNEAIDCYDRALAVRSNQPS